MQANGGGSNPPSLLMCPLESYHFLPEGGTRIFWGGQRGDQFFFQCAKGGGQNFLKGKTHLEKSQRVGPVFVHGGGGPEFFRGRQRVGTEFICIG